MLTHITRFKIDIDSRNNASPLYTANTYLSAEFQKVIVQS